MSTTVRPGAEVVIGDRSMTRDSIVDRARRLASGLTKLGVGVGSSVSLLLHNDFASLYAGLAARMLGAHVVLLSNRSAASEIAYILQDSKAATILGHADLLLQARDALPDTPVLVIRYGDEDELYRTALALLPGAIDGEAFITGHAPSVASAGSSTEAIIYTSGTTGRPKGVRRLPLDPARATENIAEMSRVFGIRPGSRVLTLGPLYHSMPDTASKLALEMADLLIVQRKFDAEAALRDIEEHRITEMTLVPTMFVRLLKLPAEVRARYDLSSLRTVTHTGAPCPPDVKRAMIGW